MGYNWSQGTTVRSHHEISRQESIEDTGRLGRDERQRTHGIEQQSQQHPALERVTLNENGGRESHAKIAQIERHLHKTALELVDLEYLAK
jgi:hypothetical protein